MPMAWRIVNERYASSAFSGQGSVERGGRWNSPGRPIVYTSWAASLAVLENLVRSKRLLKSTFVIFEVNFDQTLVKTISVKNLPKDWRSEPRSRSTLSVGDAWLDKSEYAVLEVPSVIMPHESNYLLNPRHPEFKKIAIGKPKPFAFDPRLLEK